MYNPQLLPFFILGTVLVTALAFAVIISVIIQKQRQVNSRLARQQIEFEHAKALLTTRAEVRESTLNMLARELHDNVTQALTGCFMQLNAATSLPTAAEKESMVRAARDHLMTVIRDVRLLSHSLATGMVERRELQDAIQAELTRIKTFTKIECELIPDTLVELPPAHRLLVFRVVQEALQNVVKHAQARHISVCLSSDDHHYYVSVVDDGVGFDPAARKAPSFGMLSIEERLRLLNGTITIGSASGNGTVINLQVPITQTDETAPNSDS